MGIKITVVGGASSYTPELFADLLEFRQRVEVDEVVLTDLNLEKLNFIANVCRRVLEGTGLNTQVVTSQNYEEALTGVDFVIMQIRVGGLAARVRDETVPMELGMVGNETTGAGGFACALRTVPAALNIARQIERFAPDAWLLNLSNPAGIVTEAIQKHTKLKVLGFCNIPINTTYALAHVFNVDPTTARLDSFGLNHLSWTRGFYANGEELLQPLMAETDDQNGVLYQRGLVESLYSTEWLHTLSMIPGWYLRYFYFPDQVLDQDRKKDQVRGQEDMQSEEQLRNLYITHGYNDEARAILKKKGGAQYYLPVFHVIESMINNRGEIVVLDVPNGDCMTELPADVCVEVPARVFRDRVEPLPIGPIPVRVRGLVQAVKAYEELTVEAAVTGNREAALAALMVNPLVGMYTKASTFLDRMLEVEADYMPQFSMRAPEV
jgi:6-phospho-beta-glucosidase